MMINLSQSGHYWPTMREDVVKFCHQCAICQKVWQLKHGISTPVGTLDVYKPFQYVSVDFQHMTDTPDIYGNRCLCNFICNTVKYIELVPCPGETALDAAKSYLQVFGRYGASEFIHSDKGPAFISEIISNIAILMGSR